MYLKVFADPGGSICCRFPISDWIQKVIFTRHVFPLKLQTFLFSANYVMHTTPISVLYLMNLKIFVQCSSHLVSAINLSLPHPLSQVLSSASEWNILILFSCFMVTKPGFTSKKRLKLYTYTYIYYFHFQPSMYGPVLTPGFCGKQVCPYICTGLNLLLSKLTYRPNNATLLTLPLHFSSWNSMFPLLISYNFSAVCAVTLISPITWNLKKNIYHFFCPFSLQI